MQQLQQGFDNLYNKNFVDSIRIAENILEKRYNIDALVLAGIAHFELGQYEHAIQHLQKAFSERPEDLKIAVYLLESFLIINHIDGAFTCLKKIKIKNDAIKLLEIQILERQGNYDNAIKVVQSTTDGVNKYETKAWNYELLNKLNKAKKAALNGLKLESENFKCNIVLVKLYLRKEQLKKAIGFLKNINRKSLSATNLSIYYSLKAQIFEKNNHYRKAFKFYTKSNHALKQTKVYTDLKGNNFYTLEKIEVIKKYFSKTPKFRQMVDCETDVTFMLGFPRSGTTLLENILNAHTKISSIEEKPTIEDILHFVLQTKESINILESITVSEIKELQRNYFNSRKKYCATIDNIIIDKMPLNIIHIGILYRIFPNAKFIISLRDIRDVTLSCYFQNFAINDAMANFLDWDRTQKYLQNIMDLGLSILNNFPINHIIVEYEKLVEKPFEEVKKVIEFLELPWQDSLTNYRSKIKGKNINTPSYAKISEKINTKQKQKWKKYAFLFQ